MKWATGLLVAAVLMLGAPASSQAHKDFLLLHNGDKVVVAFAMGSKGAIQFKSLSARSCVNVENSLAAGFEKFWFADKDGWKPYPGNLDGAIVTITLHEVQDNNPKKATPNLPWDSDLVVRIVNSTRVRVAGGDNTKRGTRCPVCGRVLDW